MPALIPIHQIAAADRDGYRPRWETIVSSWESNSPGAVREADDLAQEIMKRQGFPMSNLARRLREVPVEYADVTYMFRRAHALRMATDDGRFSDATTRSAMYYYSALFAFLLRDRQKIDH
jgi:protein-tyrosine-phosphatase